MDDLITGKRNKRGDWTPSGRIELAPLFTLPPRPLALLKWLPHYFLPWNLLFAASALAFWRFIAPPVETMKTLGAGWIVWLLAVNCLAVLVFYSAVELRLYVLRAQDNRFKYNIKFPAEAANDAFWRKSQNFEGVSRTFLTGVPIWTGFEVALLWAYSNGIGRG
jgi:hypothetical protein